MAASSRLPRPAQVYIATVVTGAGVLACVYAANPTRGGPDPSVGPLEVIAAAVVFTIAGFLAEQYAIHFPNTRIFDANTNTVGISSAVYIAALLLYGPAFALVVVPCSILASELARRKTFVKMVFNVAQYTVTIGVSGLFLLETGTSPRSLQPLLGSPSSILALVGTLVVYFLMNASLVSGVLAFVTGARFKDVWLQNYWEVLLQFAGMLNVGLVGAMLWTVSPFAVVLLALPLLVVQYSFRVTAQLKDETLRALIGIAEMVDARDSYAYRHSMEVSRYSNLLAMKLGLGREDVDMINLAGMLHDIGKIGTPDHVLHKPSALEDDERAIMELHPAQGAKVLQYFSLFRPGADLVLYHQEHFDGSGYPRGLRGDQIPVGARILHVADAYQAMTSDRVYRKALPVDEAVRRLVAGSGKDFDPVVVDAMLQVLQDEGVLAKSRPAVDYVRMEAEYQVKEELRDVLGTSRA